MPLLLSAYAVFGFGFALVSPPIANTAVSRMPPAQAGVAAVGGLTGPIGRGFAHATRPGSWIVAACGRPGGSTSRAGHQLLATHAGVT